MKRTLMIVALMAICAAVQIEAMFGYGRKTRAEASSSDQDDQEASYDVETNRELYRKYREMKGEKVDEPALSRYKMTNFSAGGIIEPGELTYYPAQTVPIINTLSGKAEDIPLTNEAKNKLVKDINTIQDQFAAGAIDLGEAQMRMQDAKYEAAILANPGREIELRNRKISLRRAFKSDLKDADISDMSQEIQNLQNRLEVARRARLDAQEIGNKDLAKKKADEVGLLKKRIADLQAGKLKAEGRDYRNQVPEAAKGMMSKFQESSAGRGLADILKK